MTEIPAIEGGKAIRDKLLIFGSPLIGEEEIKEVSDTLKSGWISIGPKTKIFEKLFSEYIGSNYAVGVSSCTAGLHLCMIAADIKKDDEVITTPFTFAATANVIEYQNARPVFIDIDKNTLNIDPNKIESKITSNTKAIIPVHIAGRPCKMDEILYIAQKYNLYLINDAAHAIETEFKGEKIGILGDASSYSFYATKNLTTGDGGMVTTKREDWLKKLRMLRLHGINKEPWTRFSKQDVLTYDVIFPGFKYNMTDIQASIGIHQLKRLEKNLILREKYVQIYNEAFKDIYEITIPNKNFEGKHARHLYQILIDFEKLNINRDYFALALRKENITTGYHFPSVHLFSYYKKKYGYKRGDFPNSEYVSDRIISLPLSPKLNEKDIYDVIEAVKKILNYYKRKK